MKQVKTDATLIGSNKEFFEKTKGFNEVQLKNYLEFQNAQSNKLNYQKQKEFVNVYFENIKGLHDGFFMEILGEDTVRNFLEKYFEGKPLVKKKKKDEVYTTDSIFEDIKTFCQNKFKEIVNNSEKAVDLANTARREAEVINKKGIDLKHRNKELAKEKQSLMKKLSDIEKEITTLELLIKKTEDKELSLKNQAAEFMSKHERIKQVCKKFNINLKEA
jgi:hypothetical protein